MLVVVCSVSIQCSCELSEQSSLLSFHKWPTLQSHCSPYCVFSPCLHWTPQILLTVFTHWAPTTLSCKFRCESFSPSPSDQQWLQPYQLGHGCWNFTETFSKLQKLGQFPRSRFTSRKRLENCFDVTKTWQTLKKSMKSSLKQNPGLHWVFIIKILTHACIMPLRSLRGSYRMTLKTRIKDPLQRTCVPFIDLQLLYSCVPATERPD